MSLDITPSVPAGRQIVQAYGDGRFRIAGVAHDGGVLVLREETQAWTITDAAAITADSLSPLLNRASDLDILIVGCGALFVPPPPDLREALKAHAIVLEWMDTGAGCRTFNVLLAEDRRVAAALIAVD